MTTASALLHPTTAIPFDSIEASDVEPAIDRLLATARERVSAIGTDPNEPTWDNTMGALEDSTYELEWAMGVVGHLESVMSGDALRAAYEAVQPGVSAFYAGIPLDPRLWTRLRAFADTDAAAGLDATRARALRKTLDEFRRHGAELGDADKTRLREISVALAEVTTKFAQNVIDASGKFELIVDDPARLAGLPDSEIAAARARAERAEHDEAWRFTLQAPSLFPALRYLDDRQLREQLWRAYDARACGGEFDNSARISKILELRAERAQLLGYESFADLVLVDRMAETGSKARAFVEDLEARTRPAFERERAELSQFAEMDLEPWDVGYWAEKLRRERTDFDEEALRAYFPLEQVIDGVFELAQRLYGIKIAPAPDVQSWHPDVRVYQIREGDRNLGWFHADLHPRERKRDGAWMNALVTGAADADGVLGPHVGLICANLDEPLDDRPALLRHREVETLFHEFGHLLHHMLTDVPLRSLAGTNVAWDFVELPSQIMENWCWERACVDLFARHWQTGEPIPDALFDRLLATRQFRAATAQMRQLGFATLDLSMHVEADARGADPIEYAREILARFAPAPLPRGQAMVCGFNHLFSSPVAYAAGYYSYKWAEVLDADAFSAFRDAGVFSREVGSRFRRTILARGDSRDPAALYRDFMGRDPELDPLLARNGLLKEAS
jgi:oligopeptidase A